jgi:Fe2+ transport system protein FeoA
MIPLSALQAGDIVSISCLGCAMDQACRLREMGCAEGAMARVVSINKDVILQIGDTRLAIDSMLARMILVSYSLVG